MLLQVLTDCEVLVKTDVLLGDAYPLPRLEIIITDIVSVYDHTARGGPLDGGYGTDRGGLPCSVGSEESEDLPATDLE